MTVTESTPADVQLDREQMRAIIERHMDAEAAKDVDAAVAVYTDDVVHDVVGAPTGPLAGPDQARGFYEMLTSNTTTVDVRLLREHFGTDFCVVEHQWTGKVDGEFLGIPGNGRQVSFRMLHVFEFRNGAISRENVWMDGGTIVAQLTA